MLRKAGWSSKWLRLPSLLIAARAEEEETPERPVMRAIQRRIMSSGRPARYR